MNEENKICSPFPLSSMTVTVVVWLVVYVLQWEIISTITPFFMWPIVALCFMFTAVVSIMCIRKTLKYWGLYGFSRNVGVRLIAGTLFFVSLFFSFDKVYERARFLVLAPCFDYAVEEVYATGMEDMHNVPLPPKYSGLSRGGGEVIILGEKENKTVLFYLFRGFLGRVDLYAYVPNEQGYGILLQYDQWEQVTLIRENWYFCSTI